MLLTCTFTSSTQVVLKTTSIQTCGAKLDSGATNGERVNNIDETEEEEKKPEEEELAVRSSGTE